MTVQVFNLISPYPQVTNNSIAESASYFNYSASNVIDVMISESVVYPPFGYTQQIYSQGFGSGMSNAILNHLTANGISAATFNGGNNVTAQPQVQWPGGNGYFIAAFGNNSTVNSYVSLSWSAISVNLPGLGNSQIGGIQGPMNNPTGGGLTLTLSSNTGFNVNAVPGSNSALIPFEAPAGNITFTLIAPSNTDVIDVSGAWLIFGDN